ncbi:nucleotide-binding domain-containing protein [Sodiomyces alkalinus F11]|uniref:NADPH:adrenodoxin oxidoreductase, mitochondrial n=1 Tax=Sodiomyces alkalinus (strain CBS 110278 / VKM F-3762 / F11) TaxID=1314773 RepID=A0A3N2PY24_SODAK|nr:nucleotide-binding domain-containing protein [Sodiomyces alkalinus F11]ROT39433.1 nucleotide-binding domain-containing protein [Sodiomyces alkalinus F11]
MKVPRQADAPFRMAIVGSGPAGFYTAQRILSRLPGSRVDMYESLPVPFGLVRFGVAPDHPEVKNCQLRFEEIASSRNFTFIGNTSVAEAGQHDGSCSVGLSSMLRHYDAVLLAYGASRDRLLGIPGEDTLSGIYSARQLVGWYNGLPNCADLMPDLSKGDEAVIIGQGNVALDVARILLENVDRLRHTDMPEQALETLSRSRVRRAAFTIKEVRELMKIPAVAFHPAERSLIPDNLQSLPRAPRRLMEVIVKGTPVSPSTALKSWSLDFCLSPSRFLPRENSPDNVGTTVLERTELSSKFDPDAQTRRTDSEVAIPSSLVFRSIGYKSEPLPGFDELGVLFDGQRGVVMSDGCGRVLRSSPGQPQSIPELFPGLYCAGWVKRGPTGVIASTMQDAFDTADSLIQDWLSGRAFLPRSESSPLSGWDGLSKELPGGKSNVVDWAAWKKIDQAEKERGRLKGKQREKFTRTSEMLQTVSRGHGALSSYTL